MATVPLRLRGVTPAHLTSAGIAAFPLAYSLYLAAVRHHAVGSSLLGLSAAVALLPWLSRAIARATYRAKCDEVAVHVRGEALPYRAITEVRVERSVRRETLHLRRGETVRLELVLWDAFAGRLQPYQELARRLAAAGHGELSARADRG